MKSYTTNIKCCKEHRSLITVKKEDKKYSAQCNDCGNLIMGKEEVTKLIML